MFLNRVISDHDIPTLDIDTHVILNKKAPRKVYIYSKGNMPNLINELYDYAHKFESKYNDPIHSDINEMWQDFKEIVQKTIDKNIPSKLISGSKTNLPWITNSIRKMIRKRNAAYHKQKHSKEHADILVYKHLKRNVQTQIRKSYWENVESILSGDEASTYQTQNKFWKFIKASKRDRTGTSPLRDNGLLISEAKDKADILNRQYISVFSREDTSVIPPPVEAPHPPMDEIGIDRLGIVKLLTQLKDHKACGPDLLPTKILKEAAEPVSVFLKAIFVKSLSSGTLPRDWKLANITPVYKKGDRSKPTNYRPISLTCVCSKLMEHIIVSNVMNHFTNHNVLSDKQHGFRARRSCESQLLSLTHELHEHLEKKSQIDLIVLDFSKAFDKVPHQRLMGKIWNQGIQGTTHRWINAFLTDRLQRVIVDGEASDWSSVESGVPQGTVLGPILFLSFINDLPLAVPGCGVRLFADDCVLYRPVSSQADCEALQTDLSNLEAWERKWCMSFNLDKCNIMTVTRKRNKIIHKYHLHEHELERVNSTTYLGVELSENLTWNRHIAKTCNKATKTLSFLRRNLRVRNVQAKSLAYKVLVRPTLEYCCPVWDPHHKNQEYQLEIVQRKAARFVLRRCHNTSSVTDMLQQLNWESLCQRRAKMRLTMFYKSQHALVALPLPAVVQLPIRPRPRYPHAFQVPYCSTDAYKFSFFPRAVVQWNNLPAYIAMAPTLDQFKGGLAQLYV